MPNVLRLLCLAIAALAMLPSGAHAQAMQEVIGPGDTVRVTAFRYPELTTEARVSEDGKVGVPLIGQVLVRGMTPGQAADQIAERLKSGNFLLNPQISVAVTTARSRQVSVLGYVNKPGRYTLEGSTAKVTDLIAMAGGLAADASDTAFVQIERDGKGEPVSVNLASIIQSGEASKDINLESGDSIFVPKAPVVYVYGEVTKAGSYRLEPGMTVMQAISLAGGVTPRGSDRRVKLRRKEASGGWKESSARPFDRVAPDDVIYVREALF